MQFDFSYANRVRADKPLTMSGIGKGLEGLASLLLARKLPNVRLVVTPSMDSALRIKDDISFYARLFPESISRIENYIRLYPDYGVPPYGKLSPSINHRFARLDCLSNLTYQPDANHTIVMPVQALRQSVIAKSDLEKQSLLIERGKTYPFEELPRLLRELGYTSTPNAEDPSTFAVRGGILDIFPPNSRNAFRLDFFDEELETIHFYNPSTQRTLSDVKHPSSLRITPIRDLACDNESIEQARYRIREWCDQNSFSRSDRSSLLEQLGNHVVSLEMDFLLPFFNGTTNTIIDYIPNNTEIVWIEKDKCDEALEIFREKCEQGYKRSIENKDICAPPNQLFHLKDQLDFKDSTKTISVEALNVISSDDNDSIHINYQDVRFKDVIKGKSPSHEALGNILTTFSRFVNDGYTVFFVANTQAQLDRFAFLMNQKNIPTFHLDTDKILTEPPRPGQVFCAIGALSSSYCFEDAKIVFITEDSVFGKKTHRDSNQGKSPQASLGKDLKRASLDDLQTNDLVVHVEHGVARFEGLTKLKSGGLIADYVLLKFAGSDKLYLPIYRLEKIQKFVGSPGSNPALDKLGGTGFEKNKAKAREAVKDIAANLLNLYAKRASSPGHNYVVPEEMYAEFESAFPYDETRDQLKAIRDVESDLTQSTPMDRLVCGDVGYGKTEVAMRAAFIVASENKQVAVLVPTTVLSEQHLQSFRRRYENQPFKIESLSRFRSRKEQKEILERLEQGDVDIIIGTHRLLSKDVKFKNLGMIVIDEEQRFGVEHKEKLKKLRLTTDILTLTATPIPRTLNLSLLGLRDISVIQTAPADRLSVRTHICKFDEDIIRDGIRSEISRGGQVFFIHNRVQSIPTIFRTLSELVPEIKIGVAHGQMPERELEKVMLGFYQKKFDLLLSTAIIENGLDVPSANTIFINRADTFGLSQLYQIRGRVGRSQVRAQAFLLLPEDRQITEEAKERLQVMQRHVELGSGFLIASHDLELRGAGDIIGASQSGHVSKIGYDMFMELLEEEVLRLKGEERPEQAEDVEIHAPYPAYIPEDYVKDTRTRLSIYRRFSDFISEEEIADGQAELKERYGEFPQPVTNLVWLLHVKVLMRRYGMVTLRVSKDKFSLEGGANPKIDVTRLMQLIAKNPSTYSFSSDSKLVVRRASASFEDVFSGFRELISAIADL